MKRMLLGVLGAALPVPVATPTAEATGASTLLEHDDDWTEVGGILRDDTTWTAEGGPYRVTQALQVPSDATLTIEAATATRNVK